MNIAFFGHADFTETPSVRDEAFALLEKIADGREPFFSLFSWRRFKISISFHLSKNIF